jgi:hypothetical protein
MSFARYQRLTSGISHELPTTAAAATQQNSYPVAQQVPLSQDPTNAASKGQYNTTQNDTQTSPTPISVVVPHEEPVNNSKIEI